MTSIDAARSSSTNVAIRSPRLVYLRLKRGDDAGDRAHRAVVEVGELGDRALDVAAQRPLGAHQRVVAHVEAEHLLLGAQPLGLVELEVGDRRGGRRTPARVAGRRRPGRTGSSCPARVRAGAAARRRRSARTRGSRPLRGWPSESKRAAVDQRLDRALVEHRRDRRVRRSRGSRRTARSGALLDDQRRRRLRRRCAPRRARTGPRRCLSSVAELAGEVALRRVDVGDEHRDVELAALVEVHGGLVEVGLDAREQRGEVLHRDSSP